MKSSGWPVSTSFMAGLVVLLASCAAPTSRSTAEDEQAIRDVASAWAAALSRSDLDGIFAQWADDGIEFPPGPARVGKAAIRERFAQVLTGGTVAASISFDEVHVAGDWAWARGTFEGTWTPDDGSAQGRESNHNLWILQRSIDGSWRIARMMWHTNQPPAEAGN